MAGMGNLRDAARALSISQHGTDMTNWRNVAIDCAHETLRDAGEVLTVEQARRHGVIDYSTYERRQAVEGVLAVIGALGNTRATGNASGNTESDGNPVTSDRKPAT